MLRTTIYGSGDGGGTLPTAGLIDPLALLNTVIAAPLTFLNLIAAPFGTKKDDGMDSRVNRQFTPHGEVVPQMSTRNLNSKNIFGSGGSQ